MKIGIIPARLNSTRFPNKILEDIDGLPMVVRVAKQVEQSTMLDRVIVAVDDSSTYNIVKNYNIEAQMTLVDHQSGTDRVAEVSKQFDDDDIIINIQGDEPLINPGMVDKFISVFDDSEVQMATIGSTHLSMNDLQDRNVVKVCVDENMYADNFTRILWSGNTINKLGGLYKHIGIYGFRQKTLKEYALLEPTQREIVKRLEQMRALDNNIKIKVLITDYDSISVDIKDDLEKVKKSLKVESKQAEYDGYLGYYKNIYKKKYNSDINQNATLMLKKVLGDVFKKEDTKTLLDYGCGQGIQYSEAKVHELWGIKEVECYDPAIEQYSMKPDKSKFFDAIICIDVMEHIPERSVNDILQDIFAYKTNLVFFSISTVLAKAKLPDGSNAHCTVKSADWWLKKLKVFKRKYKQTKILLKVKSKLYEIVNS